MKKLFFTAVFLMAAVILFSQSLEKGNLVGVHVLNLNLKPGISESQATAFVLEKMIPADEKYFGIKEFLMKGVRGKFAGKYAMIMVFKDENARDKFFDGSEEATKAMNHIQEEMKEVNAEADNLWYTAESIYNDYVISTGKSEEIKKGVLIGIHNETPKLNQGFNEAQYIDYYSNKVIPAWESYEPEMAGNVSRSIRGADSTKIGVFITFRDESIRAKFFDNENHQTQYFKDFEIRNKEMLDGWNKIGTREFEYTDWIVL